jgi:putative DNA methylase
MQIAVPRLPRRLIEVDLPIASISAHARDGRSVHHGHITAIHIWWARKPLPSCRAILLAAALPDPADDACPPVFRQVAVEALASLDSQPLDNDREALRRRLLRLISDNASWQVARDPGYAAVVRRLVAAAHEALHGPGLPLLADPFCGGGSIPLEALRAGASAYASDLNPVAALISKVTLEYVQRYGQRLFEEVARAGESIDQLLCDELSRYFPSGDGPTPVAYVSFRRIRCDGPECGAEVVLSSKFQLARRGARSVGLVLAGWDGGTPRFDLLEGPLASFPAATVRRGAASCLKCGFTMPVERVREQLTQKGGGSQDALLVAVATANADGTRGFRRPTVVDQAAIAAAVDAVAALDADHGGLPVLPDEPLPPIGSLGFRVQRYGMTRWRDLFTARQLVTLSTLVRLLREVLPDDRAPDGLGVAVRSCLALAVDRVADHQNTGCSWNPSGSALPHLFTRQAIPIIWDFGEANPLASSSGSWSGAVQHVVRGLRNALVTDYGADVGLASASHHPLPTDCAHILITDPPYYDAIPYADLSDFFYVWLRRMVGDDHPGLFGSATVMRDDECIVNRVVGKDSAYYRRVMTQALAEARRVTRPDGVGVIIFAHKSTTGWEDLLAAMIEAGWIITASWPIDTENAGRLRAQNSAVLASSIHLVCRPREHSDGRLITDTVGDWREVLSALPGRIHAWMPRLAEEGVVGADALFACLGPALELFSRFARVEKVSGEVVPLSEYLVHVWGAVAREALSMIFEDADTTGLEADARVTAMWLWTLAGGQRESPDADTSDEPLIDVDEVDGAIGRYTLEFDAARKIAQGLGARLEELGTLVEVKGGMARLLSVRERRDVLLGTAARTPVLGRAVKGGRQAGLFESVTVELAATGGKPPEPGQTTLDRLHQAMLLFGAGQAEVLKRFLVESAIGEQPIFWRLAQALSAIYPPGSDENRWVDGVLARKKGLKFR